MSVFKKNGFLRQGIALGVTAIVLLLLLLSGSWGVCRGIVPETIMNIYVRIAVFLSILMSGRSIFGVREGGNLTSNAISVLLVCVCLAIFSLAAGEGGVNPLMLLENFAAASFAFLVCTFVQIRQKRRRKKLRKRR